MWRLIGVISDLAAVYSTRVLFEWHIQCHVVSQNNETAAILVSQTYPPVGVVLFSYANAFFCSIEICIDASHVSENTLLEMSIENVNS